MAFLQALGEVKTKDRSTNGGSSQVPSQDQEINKAAGDRGVPPTALRNRLNGWGSHGTKPGPMIYLSIGCGKTRKVGIHITESGGSVKGVFFRTVLAMGGGVDFWNVWVTYPWEEEIALHIFEWTLLMEKKICISLLKLFLFSTISLPIRLRYIM